MFLQSNEILTHELKAPRHNLCIRISANMDKREPWRVDIYKNQQLIKFFDGYISAEGARNKVNSFVKESREVFSIDWVKEELFHVQLMKKNPPLSLLKDLL